MTMAMSKGLRSRTIFLRYSLAQRAAAADHRSGDLAGGHHVGRDPGRSRLRLPWHRLSAVSRHLRQRLLRHPGRGAVRHLECRAGAPAAGLHSTRCSIRAFKFAERLSDHVTGTARRIARAIASNKMLAAGILVLFLVLLFGVAGSSFVTRAQADVGAGRPSQPPGLPAPAWDRSAGPRRTGQPDLRHAGHAEDRRDRRSDRRQRRDAARPVRRLCGRHRRRRHSSG